MFQMQQTSLAERVRRLIRRWPHVQHAIDQDIVNYSALARQIAVELGDANVPAVKAALLRYSRRLREEKHDREETVMALLQHSHFSIQNKVAAVHVEEPLSVPSIAYSKTPSGYMYFIGQHVRGHRDFNNVENGLAIIHIRSPPEIEHTPGAAAFLLSALASEDINVVHLMDCREDTFLVIEETDAPRAFTVLADRLQAEQ